MNVSPKNNRDAFADSTDPCVWQTACRPWPKYVATSSRRAPRAGVTILEVLFAILVATIGLLGAIAVIPVAATQARKGQIADSAAVAGNAAIHEFDARSMRDTRRWLAWDGTNYTQIARPSGNASYCIDPRFVTKNTGSGTALTFPYNNGAGAASMPRLNLTADVLPFVPFRAMNAIQAEYEFTSDDDLVILRPTAGDLPATQQYRRDNTEAILTGRRQSGGAISWFATVTPIANRYWTTVPTTDDYLLSVVVVENRPTILATTDYPDQEWTVGVSQFHSIGAVGTVPQGNSVALGGGDIQISAPSADLLDVKRDQWIMLAAVESRVDPADATSYPAQVQRHQWYRITDLDDEIAGTGPFTREITIQGRDWNTDLDGDGASDACAAVIVRGVIAVYEKTIKLDIQ